MRPIVRDFWRENLSLLIRMAIIIAVCAACLALTGIYERESTRIAGIIVTCFLALSLLWQAAGIFVIYPLVLKKQLSRLSAAERTQVLSGYGAARSLGARRFYQSGWLLSFSNGKLTLLRISDVKSAQLRGTKIQLITANGKKRVIKAAPDESAAIILAALRSINPAIKAGNKENFQGTEDTNK